MEFESILKFLRQLSKNNDRVWFEKNKSRYLEVKQYFEDFVTAMLAELVRFNDGYEGLDPRKLPFRIYRDVRFSKDKRPYKTNMGAGFSPGGKMMQEPGYYLHIEPGNKSFLAGGLYMPDATNLAKIRQEIDYNFNDLKKILTQRKFKSWFDTFDDFDKLKTAPKGYPKDHPNLELLKLKSFIVTHSFTDQEVQSRNFLKKIVEGCKEIKPLNEFLKEAIS